MAVFGLAVYALDFHAVWHLGREVEIVLGTADRRVNSVMYHPNLFAGFLVLAMGVVHVTRTEGAARG